MDRFLINVEPEDAGMRMDAYLASVTDNSLSRTYIQKLMEQGQISVNGVPEKLKKYKIKNGDVLEILIPEPENLDVEAEDIPLDIVYEDEDLAVINKPKGMVVHPAPGNEKGTMVNALLYHCKDLSSIGGVIRPGIVHRIDKDTSGLIMIAKNDNAHISLAEQLKVHSITRVYNAVVFDNIKEDEGTVDAPLGRNPNNRFKMAVVSDGKRAVTHYKVLERFGAYTFIEARLETGRTHQIRVHMAYKKHPLVGDAVYGPAKKVMGAESQMLHAKVLGFKHPRTGEYMEFSSELPEEFLRVLEKLREK
ncbi:MAG: RluA family pseudouridine synthase [Clostridiales bacterium]|nr:RluA family pseudouridine synthase [Clostridiales bacterium]